VRGGGVGSVDGLLAENLDDAAVLDVPHVLQLVEDVARLVLDQDGRVGRLQHARGQLLREHVHDERVQRVQAAELVGDVHAARLVAVLQEQHAWEEEGGDGGENKYEQSNCVTSCVFLEIQWRKL